MVIDYSEGHGYSILKECEGCEVKLLEDDLENTDTVLRSLKNYGVDIINNPEDIAELVFSFSAMKALSRESGQEFPNDLDHSAFWKLRPLEVSE